MKIYGQDYITETGAREGFSTKDRVSGTKSKFQTKRTDFR